MKKYILPIGILLISIFLLNTVIEPKEPEKVSNSETNDEKSRLVPAFKADEVPDEKPLLIYEGDNFLAQLSKDDVETAAKKVRPLEVKPYQHAWLKFEEYTEHITISEWDEGKESEPENTNTYETGGIPGVKVLLIRTQRRDKSAAVYVAKVRVKNIYSYQKHLSPNINNYTVIGFFADDESKIAMPHPMKDFYDIRALEGSLESHQNEFPELDIRNLPTYYLFKKGNILYKTGEYKELVAYLNQENVLTFEGKSDNWEVNLFVRQNLKTIKQQVSIRYIGKSALNQSPVDLEVSGPSWNWGSSIDLDKDKKLTSEVDVDIEVSPEDSITCILKWNGKEEQIELFYAN
ncbi:hypothetical protein D1B31_05015 [Neobacillus notoginsengisoli]|uniref:Uncharacterized protein n=1 Tax=Neobacillus notoginsengisoli TaxID=1578198 RepID=A0A417YWN4_9BACI|nr:hypothetical protein [Neobacillus notoginsengisoli]RHW42007.1 hypothetical protein D1B31_05015 [Neobacillus notoginsengisoli]